MTAAEIRPARFPEDLDAVRSIFTEYVRSATVSLEFQDYAAEFASLPGKYAPPQGRLLLAWRDGRVVGCAALRPVDPATGEMKRVYVRPAARGTGLGRRLVARIVEEARNAGYARICLDVLPEFEVATRIYESLGFADAERWRSIRCPGRGFSALSCGRRISQKDG